MLDSTATPSLAVIALEQDMKDNLTNSSHLIHALYTTCNTTTSIYSEWGWLHTLKLFTFGPIVFLAIFGNFLTLFAFVTRYRQMKSPTHYFIANLALADFFVGILCLPFLASQAISGKWSFGQEFCFAYVIMHFWFCSCSIYSTCAICVERYVGVRHPLSHKKIMSIPRIIMAVVFIWIYGGAVTFASLFIWPDDHHISLQDDVCTDVYECKINQELGHILFSTIFILYIPALLMVTLYWRIYILATKHLQVLKNSSELGQSIRWRNESGCASFQERPTSIVSVSLDSESGAGVGASATAQEGNSKPDRTDRQAASAKKIPWFPMMRLPLTFILSSNASVPKNMNNSTESLVQATSSKKHINLAKRLVFLVGVLLLSYIPYYTIFLVRAFNPELVSKEVFNVFKWIRYFNSAINPFLYAFAVPAYRKAFVNIVVRRKFFP